MSSESKSELREDKAYCAHREVVYEPIDNGNGTMSDRWKCVLCGSDFWPQYWFFPAPWAALSRQATPETEQLAQWMIVHSFATGHGDKFADLLNELSWQVAELRSTPRASATRVSDTQRAQELSRNWFGHEFVAPPARALKLFRLIENLCGWTLLTQATREKCFDYIVAEFLTIQGEAIQALTEHDVACAYQSAPRWGSVLSSLQCRIVAALRGEGK
jgi:hypothetical protein